MLLSTIAIVSWRANGRLEERLNAIRAEGDPVTLHELARDPIPGDRNAVTYLRRVEQQVLAINHELQETLNDDGPYREGGKLNGAGADLVRATLASHPDVLPQLERAATSSDYDPMYDYSAPPATVVDAVIQSAGPSRSAARLLNLQTDLLIFEGKRDEALRTSVITLQLGRQLEHEPFLVGFLVSLGVRGGALDRINQILLDGPISDETSQLLKNELAKNDDMAGFAQCLKSERVQSVASFRNLSPAGMPLWYVKNWESDYLEMMASELAMGPKPQFAITNELSEQNTRITSSYGPLVQLVFPSLQASREAMDRVRAQVRCLYVLCELRRSTGDLREANFDIERLGLDKRFTTDPYTGSPLLTKKTPQGWTVYSVGRNGTDDGGSIGSPYDDVGAGTVPTE